MSTRALLVIPAVVAVIFLVAQSLVPAQPARTYFFTIEIATVKVLAVVGCWLAASRYRRGEYLGIAWTLLGCDYALLFIKDLLFGKTVHLPGLSADAAATWRVVFVVL